MIGQNYIVTVVGPEDSVKESEKLLALLLNAFPAAESGVELRSIIRLPLSDEFKHELVDLIKKHEKKQT